MLNFYQLERLVEDAMRTAKVPGAALAIVHERRVIYARGFGVTSVEDGGQAVTAQTIFRIGSTSKPLTSTAIMRLVEAGKLELDTPIDEILPDLELSERGAVGKVTLRKLMTHTAGLPTAGEHYGAREAAGLRAGVYGDIAHYPLIAPVGKLWSYSNPGINFAGYIAEVVSGKPYTKLMQELVFDPLDMRRTTFDPTVAMTYPIAQSHTLDAEGNLKVDHHYADNTAHYPSGFVMSTVLDLANFAILHLSGGSFNGQQILSAESVEAMHRPYVTFPSIHGDGYGLTFSSFNYKGVRQVGHGGRISSFASQFELVPATGTAVILLANNSAQWAPQEEAITRFILDGLLDLPAEAEPLPVMEPDRASWDAYVGIYAGVMSGAAEVVREDDQLAILWQGKKLPLKAVGVHLFVTQPDDGEPMPIGFSEIDTGHAEYAHVLLAPGYSLALRRLVYDPQFQPETRAWAAYAGTYTSPYGTLTVRVDGDQMVVGGEMFGGAEFPARPIDAVRFLLPVELLTFDAPNRVRFGAALYFDKLTSEEVR